MARLRHHLGLLGAFALSLAVVLLLTAGIWAAPGSRHLLTAFGDSHAWVLEQLAQGRTTGRHCVAGYPEARELRLIGWGPLLLGLPLRAVVGTVAAFHLLLLVSLPLSAAAAAALVRRWTGAGAGVQACLGAAYALCPTLLATLGAGELPKLQAWILPVALLALDDALRAGHGPVRRLAQLVLLGLVGLVSAFTSPYYALALPLLAGGMVLGQLWRHRRLQPAAALLRGGLVLGALYLGLSPAADYYEDVATGSGQSIFQPARRAELRAGPLPRPQPVAEPYTLLLGPRQGAGSPYEAAHVPTLGLGLLGLGLLGLRRRREATGGRGAGLALAAGGVLLAMGPALVLGGAVVGWGDTVLALPVYLLELLDYPTAKGGLYFRYALVAVLGLVLLGARGLARHPRAAGIAAVALLLNLAHGLGITLTRAIGPTAEAADRSEPWRFWPRPAEEIAAHELLASLRGGDGAVLELPLQGPTDGHLGQAGLLRAVFHGRPTTSLPRDRQGGADPARAALRRAVAEGSSAPLQELGVRYVILDLSLDWYAEPDASELTEALGPPAHGTGPDAALRVWDLGPTEVRCLGEGG